MHLGHRAVDAPAGTHFAPVQNEFLFDRCDWHLLFRIVCKYRNYRSNDSLSRDHDWRTPPAAARRAPQTPKAGFSAGLSQNGKQHYFLGAMASLAALATRNFTTVLALIWMGSPV